MENQCAVCQVPAGLRCGACKQVAYCCKEHQKRTKQYAAVTPAPDNHNKPHQRKLKIEHQGIK